MGRDIEKKILYFLIPTSFFVGLFFGWLKFEILLRNI